MRRYQLSLFGTPFGLRTNRPRVWVGGSARAASVRTVHYGTGWQASFQIPEEAGKIVADILKSRDNIWTP